MPDFANPRPLAPLPDLEQARRYLRLLYGKNASGYLNLCTFDGQVEWFPVNDIDAVADRAVALASSHNVYHSIAPRSENYYRGLEDPAKERGGSADVTTLPGFWLDVDFLDPVHKKTKLPPTPYAALDLIAEFPLKPTLVVESGHGYQAWYLFQRLWDLPTDEERSHAEALLARFQHHMLSLARDHGWTLDNTSDLARVFRVAGSLNWKDRDHALPVKVVAGDETRRYTPEDFERQLPCEPASEPTAKQESRSDLPLSAAPLLDDNDLLRRAMAAKDGPKFARLWVGDLADFGGDDSAGDMSLSDLLAFWTNHDPIRMDRLFRRSGLWRPKWDEVHYANGETYGEHTIDEAIAKTAQGYTGTWAPAPPPASGNLEDPAATDDDAFTDSNDRVFPDPQAEIDYLRRALAAERAKGDRLEREVEDGRQERARLRQENETLRRTFSLQWQVFGNQRLKGAGLTAVKLAMEYTAAVEHHRDVDGWAPISLSGDYGVASGAGKSDKRAGGDLKKLCGWAFFDKRNEREQITEGPNTGQIRTHLYVRPTRDVNQILAELARFDPQQPSWGGKRIPRCPDHPSAEVIRRTTYSCKECGQILGDPREQAFGPEGQDVPSGIEDIERTRQQVVRADFADLADPLWDDPPEGTRCPTENETPQTPVDIRTLDGRFDGSGASPPDEPSSPAESTGNPLYDLTRKLFPGSYFAEEGLA